MWVCVCELVLLVISQGHRLICQQSRSPTALLSRELWRRRLGYVGPHVGADLWTDLTCRTLLKWQWPCIVLTVLVGRTVVNCQCFSWTIYDIVILWYGATVLLLIKLLYGTTTVDNIYSTGVCISRRCVMGGLGLCVSIVGWVHKLMGWVGWRKMDLRPSLVSRF